MNTQGQEPGLVPFDHFFNLELLGEFPGESICFLASKFPYKQRILKKKFTTKSNTSKKEEKKGPERKNVFGFFDFVVKISSKTW
jgi:hypothetical protein